MKQDSLFFSLGDTPGIPWFRLYLADSLAGQFSPDQRDMARWFLLHMAVQAGNGHIRTSLLNLEEEMADWCLPAAGEGGKLESLREIPALVAGALPGILDAARICRVLGTLDGEDSRVDLLDVPRPPLVITHDGRWVYFLRRRREEDSLLDALSRRVSLEGIPVAATPEPPDPAGMIARRIAEGRRLILLAGGPGTGKTTTVARLLELMEADVSSDARRPETVLAAPTGRAAARMAESLSRDPGGIPTLRGRTLHSLLGIVPGRPARHNAENPVPADLVIVDEASMVDLPLMNRLLAALPGKAVLVLVGDPDQLPSVEAGALLGDLLRGDQQAAGEGRHGPLSGSVVTLSRVYRSDQAILEAASAIRDGDYELLMKHFLDEAVPAVELHTPGTPESMARIIASGYRENPEGGRRSSGSTSGMAVLTPLRRGPWGVPAMNDRVSWLLGGTTGAFPGMPVMITGNDRQRNLWNGDRGIIGLREGRLRAVLPGADGERDFPLAALPGWEPAWIQTIHKSQGSEFDTVRILLPAGARGVITRELLYTAFTRARHGVSLYADPEVIKAALNNHVRRHSRVRLWAEGR